MGHMAAGEFVSMKSFVSKKNMCRDSLGAMVVLSRQIYASSALTSVYTDEEAPAHTGSSPFRTFFLTDSFEHIVESQHVHTIVASNKGTRTTASA